MTWTPDHAVTCLKEDGLRSVWLVQRPGETPRTCKSWPLNAWVWCKHLLGLSQPRCQVRGAQRLAKAGIPTPTIAQLPRLCRVEEGSRRSIVLELEYIPGETALQHLQEGAVETDAMLAVARQIGELVSRIASAGLLHRDLKLSNLVIEETDEEPTAWVIDPVGVRRCRSRSTATFRMLERLDVEIRERRSVAEGAWSSVLREALRSLNSSDRQAVLQQLREHPRP